MPRKAVVLLSGGLDSTTTLAIARSEGFDAHAMTFRYGQRHAAEIDAAYRIAAQMNVAQHVVVDIDLRMFGGSALTADLPLPVGRAPEEMARDWAIIELATPLIWGIASGLRLDYVMPPSGAGFPYNGRDYTWLTWGLAYRISERIQIGGSSR